MEDEKIADHIYAQILLSRFHIGYLKEIRIFTKQGKNNAFQDAKGTSGIFGRGWLYSMNGIELLQSMSDVDNELIIESEKVFACVCTLQYRHWQQMISPMRSCIGSARR